MNASPHVGNEAEPKSLGRTIFNRIGTLERSRLQFKCLQMMSALPVWDQLVFRGATAFKAQSKAASVSPNKEQEMLSRRAALRRIGMTGGMTVLGLLTIDELARVSAQKLEQNELTRGIAKDFRSAGVAFADPGISADDYEDCDTNEFGEIVWLGPGVCAKTPKKAIPVPKSCENPNADGNAPNCNECSSDYLAACFERADEKYSGWWRWSSRTTAKDVCRQAATGCITLCSGDDSPAAVSDFAECYKTATSGT